MHTPSVNRRHVLRLIAGSAVVLGTAPTSAGAVAAAKLQTAGEPRRGGTLTYAHLSDIFSFDPVQMTTGNFPMPYQLYNTLIRLDENSQPQPELAESWSMTDDGRSITLTMRPGVRFHNGEELIGEDVVATFQHYQDPEATATIRNLSLLVTQATAPERNVVRLDFEQPAAAIFDLLSQVFVIQRDAIAEVRTNPVGTGPFQLTEWLPGDRTRLERFPDYWKEGLPLLDEVVIQPIPDPQSLVINLQAGSVDVAQQPPFSELERLGETGEIEVILYPEGATVQDLLLNVEQPPFDNQQVRQAMNFAINRQRFVDIYSSGFGEPWCQPVPETSLAYVSELADSCAFDLERARTMLAEAGYGSGFSATMLTSSGGFLPGSLELAQILQADLAQIGVTVEIQDLEESVARPQLVQGDFQMAGHFYVRSNRDPSSLFEGTLAWRPDTNASLFSSEQYAALLREGATTPDLETRRGIYQDVTRLVLDAAFTLPVAGLPRAFALRSPVRGFSWSLDSFAQLEETWLAE